MIYKNMRIKSKFYVIVNKINNSFYLDEHGETDERKDNCQSGVDEPGKSDLKASTETEP